MSYTPDDIAEIARLTGWHLGTARPAIMPPPTGTELAGRWYDADGREMACAFTDDLMGETQFSVEQARAYARERANPLGGFLSDENSPDHPTVFYTSAPRGDERTHPMIYRESPGDWRGETNDVLHRLELIEQRDGALDFSPESGLHNLLTHAFNAAQRVGVEYAVHVAQLRAEESDNPAVRAALLRLADALRVV